MANIAICEHIKDNGDTCGSPALTGHSFCHFHQRLRQPRPRPGDFEYKLPIFDNPHSILMATQHITQAALDGVLEPSRARLVLSALRLAMAALKEIKKADMQKKSTLVNSNTGLHMSSRAPQLDEESASASVASAPVRGAAAPPEDTTEQRQRLKSAVAAPEGGPRRQPRVSVTSISRVPEGATERKPPLSADQLKLVKKILRRGPSHPRFATAARLLDHHIAGVHD